jgi:hypothetical protein
MVAAFNNKGGIVLLKSLIVKNDEAFAQKCTLIWI